MPTKPQPWYWYVARENELLIDCDSETLLAIALKRLKDTGRIHEAAPLNVRKVFTIPSQSEGHFHLAVELKNDLPVLHRMTWQLFLMDDTSRSVHNFFRVLRRIKAPSLVISPYNWLTENRVKRFWRTHDAVCFCDLRVHKNNKSIFSCPAHKKLRGESYDRPPAFLI